MFGDEIIRGQGIKKVDCKNRICLPNFTHAEQGEKLDVLYSYNRSNIEIYSNKHVENSLKTLREMVEKNRELASTYEMMLASIIDTIEVDSSNRTIIPTSAIKKLNLFGEVYIEGAYNCLRIFKKEEDLDTYTRRNISEKESDYYVRI